jgi:CHRD domain
MRKLLVVTALALVLLSAPAVARADLIFVTQLSGAGENPPTSSPAMGTATFILKSSLTEIDFTISFGVDVGGPALTTPLQAGHIHFGVPGTNGPVILPFPNLPSGMTSGTFTGVLTAANLTPSGPIMTFADAVNALETGNTYANLHTSMFPGGEIRGQIPAAAPVPELSSLALLAIGALGLLAYRRPS